MAEYGQDAPITYNSYLCVPELKQLQRCLADPGHPDEMLFIIIHQTYELWFKLILQEIDQAIEGIDRDRLAFASRCLNRICEIERVLISQIHILETMTPKDFLRFREELKPASGFQSAQFREIEFSTGCKDPKILSVFQNEPDALANLQRRLGSPTLHDAFFTMLTRRGYEAPLGEAHYGQRTRAMLDLLQHFEDRYEEFLLADKLIEHDENILLWRAHHVSMVERMLGAKGGTGGSSGVEFLRSTLGKKCFPEMWEARSYLGHDASSGCPMHPSV